MDLLEKAAKGLEYSEYLDILKEKLEKDTGEDKLSMTTQALLDCRGIPDFAQDR